MQRLILIICLLQVSLSAHAVAATRVDLKIDSVQIQPPRVETKSVIVVVPSIRNSGSQEAGSFYISVTLEHKDKIVKTIPNVPVISKLPRNGSGLSIPVEIGYLPEGNYVVEVIADAGDLIAETNERNNRLRKEFRVWEPAYRSVTYGYN